MNLGLKLFQLRSFRFLALSLTILHHALQGIQVHGAYSRRRLVSYLPIDLKGFLRASTTLAVGQWVKKPVDTRFWKDEQPKIPINPSHFAVHQWIPWG